MRKPPDAGRLIEQRSYWFVARIDALGQIEARITQTVDHREVGEALLSVKTSGRSDQSVRLVREVITRTVEA